MQRGAGHVETFKLRGRDRGVRVLLRQPALEQPARVLRLDVLPRLQGEPVIGGASGVWGTIGLKFNF